MKNQKELAKEFTNAIRTMAQRPENIDNLEDYLSYHFAAWMEKFASTPEAITGEMMNFASMEI